MLQSALDLERLPPTLSVEHVSYLAEFAVVEFDSPLPSVRDVRLRAEVVEHVARHGIVVGLDCGDSEETILVDRCSPPVLRDHRSEERAFHRGLSHTPAGTGWLVKYLGGKPRGTRLAFSVENILRRAEVTGMRAMRCLLPPVQSTLTRRELSYETPLIGERIHHAEWDGLAGIRTRGLFLAKEAIYH